MKSTNHRHNQKQNPITAMLDEMVEHRGEKHKLLFMQSLIQREYKTFLREKRKDKTRSYIDAKFAAFHKNEAAWLESRIPMLMELIRPELVKLVDERLQ